MTDERTRPMPRYAATFSTTLRLVVEVEADDEEKAADLAWEEANKYLQTVHGNARGVRADADLDGIGADEVDEV